VTKELEIVDDAGDEFSVTNIPIPFYIRLKLDDGRIKYRTNILDEAGNIRSFYTGVTDKNFLELHVPVIPLRDYGKIIIEIEVSDIDSKEITKYQATIDYVSQEEYTSIKESENTEEVEEVEIKELDAEAPVEGEELVDEPTVSSELSSEELAYLTQRAEVLQETKDEKTEIVTNEIFSLDGNEEE